MPAAPTGTVTLLFTDIEGSTHLWEQHPDAMVVALARHDELLRSVIVGGGGYVFKTVGDAFCAAFDSAPEAVTCAATIQRSLSVEPWPDSASLRVRVALNSGDCESRDGDYFGPTVNRTARITALGHGGQVLVSHSTVELLGDWTPPGARLVDLGSHELKDLRHPERIFQLDLDGLVTDFPPLRFSHVRRSHDPPNPTNLRAPASRLVGRDDDVAHVVSLLGDHRLVTLVAAGGVGKTRLAMAVGQTLLPSLPDGVWFVDLAAVTDPALVPAQVMSDLQITERAGEAAIDTVLDVLASQHRLVIVDNCEHLIVSCALLVEAVLARCPDIRLICTSREAIRIDGETTFRVPSLSLPSSEVVSVDDVAGSGAVSLFLERAESLALGFALSDENAPVVASICRRLDGVPLALELAAARLRSMTVNQIHERLENRFELLTGGSRVALARHRTLGALVDWSFDLLDQQERSVFRRLSVFVDGFNLEAAEEVCSFSGVAAPEVAGVLGSLVDKSLVVADLHAASPRFRLHETLREYGRDRLRDGTSGPAGESEAVLASDAHARHYLTLALRAESALAGRAVNQCLAALQVDDANIREAVRHALTRPDMVDLVLDQFWAAQRYWASSRQPALAADLLQGAVDQAVDQTSPRRQARARLLLGTLLFNHDRRRQLVECSRALDFARVVGDPALEALCLASFSASLSHNGRDDDLAELNDRAVALARGNGDPGVLCEVISRIEWEPADDAQQLALVQEAIELAARSGDVFLESRLHLLLALYALIDRLDNVDVARRSFERALELVDGTRPRFALALESNLGLVLLIEGEAQRAADIFSKVLRLARLSGHRSHVAYMVLDLAIASSRLGELERASFLHGGADSLRSEFSDLWESVEEALRHADTDALRAQLGTDFDRYYADGLSAPHGEVIRLALA